MPKKESMLILLLALTAGRWHFLQRIGIVARIVYNRSYGHRRWREILHLLQLKSRVFRLTGEICHILQLRSRMAGDKVGYQLLLQAGFGIKALKFFLECVKNLNEGLRINLRTESEVCSGAIFNRPDT